jgi:hypothetical protein
MWLGYPSLKALGWAIERHERGYREVSAPAVVRVTGALAPIQDALQAMAADPERPLRGIRSDLAAHGPGWVPATDLTSGDAVDRLLAAARMRWQASPHAAAALAWKSYSYWLALPAVLGYAAARRVPLLRPDAVQVSWSVTQPFLRVALIPDALEVAVLGTDPVVAAGAAPAGPVAGDLRVAADEDELLALLRAALLDDHLEPLIDQLRRRVHLGRHALLGSVASGIAHALSRGADALSAPTLELAHRLLDALGLAALVDLAPVPGGMSVHRRTCCLAFTLPTPKVCTDCCIR